MTAVLQIVVPTRFVLDIAGSKYHNFLECRSDDDMISLARFESPAVGLEVISARGTPGHITEVRELSELEAKDFRDTSPGDLLISILWKNDKTSTFPQWELDAIHVKDRDTSTTEFLP